MTLLYNFLITIILPALLGMASVASPVLDGAVVPTTNNNEDMFPRTTGTCADPSITQTVSQWFSGSKISHNLHFHWAFVNADSTQPAGPAFWTFQGSVFKAWPTQQPFTVPFFRFTNAAQNDFIFMTGVDAQTPPVVSGFGTSSIFAWVYNASICDSVPLMGAFLAPQSDHYYTTDPNEHSALLAAGWADTGVAAFVLPLPSL